MIAWWGCTYYVDLPATDPTRVPDPTLGVPGLPPGDLASIVVHTDTLSTTVYGLFVESAPNPLDLARCTIGQVPCLPRTAPHEGPPVPWWPAPEPETLRSRFVGDPLVVGPFEVPYREEKETGLGSYVLAGVQPVEGWLDVAWGGQWLPYEGTEDLFVSPPIVRSSPDLRFVTDGALVPVEWDPAGATAVALTIASGADGIVYTLDDDGFFALDTDEVADALGLLDPYTPLDLTLARVDSRTLLADGNVVELAAISETVFSTDLIQVGARERSDPAASCAMAQGSIALAPGAYWGVLDAALSADLDLAPSSRAASCLDPQGVSLADDSLGPDGVYRLELAGGATLDVHYDLLGASGAVYLLADCAVTSCLAGADLVAGPGPESVTLTNGTADPSTVFLVVDATTADGEGAYLLDIVETP